MDWLASKVLYLSGLEPEAALFLASLILAWLGSLIYFLRKNEVIILQEHPNLTPQQCRRRLIFGFVSLFLGVIFCVAVLTPDTAAASLVTGIMSEATIDKYISAGTARMSKKIEAKITEKLNR